MSETSGGALKDPTKFPLTRSSLMFLGFGYFRNNQAGQHWFRYRDFEKAVPEGPYKKFVTPTKGHYSKWLKQHIELGVMEGRAAGPGDDYPVNGPNSNQTYARATDQGEALLLDGLLYATTHTGLSVPELIHMPEVASAILYGSDLLLRVSKQVAGGIEPPPSQLSWL